MTKHRPVLPKLALPGADILNHRSSGRFHVDPWRNHGGSCCADHSALELNVGSTNGSYMFLPSI